MWCYQRRVRMRDTDATGALFFGAAFEMAVEAFQEWLEAHHLKLEELSFLLPIVHAQADYFVPIKLGDYLSIELSIKNIGTTSFGVEFLFLRETKVALVEIIHVTVSLATGHKIEIPSPLKHLLEQEGSSKI
jgi:1,4-dihydroxy-2-naphthoyl-CoA hydrolase